MKQLLRRMLILVAVFAVAHWNTILFAQYFSGGSEQRAVLKIKSDGSSELTSTVVQSRQAMEGQVRMFERYQKMSEGMGEEGETPKPDAGEGATEPKPFTDVELAQKIRESIKNQSDQLGEDSGEKVNLDVQKDTVRVETIRSFASVEELLKEGYTIWHAGGMMFQNARFEKDTNGLLRVTFTPQANMERYFKNLRAQWKLSGTKTEFKLVFPGKVLSSGFPETQTNTTWIAIDAKNDETLDAAFKLYSGPIVITAELGGLKLDQPLESKKLQRVGRRRGVSGDELPLTEAGPGFVAEPQSITTTTLHVFPGGEDYLKQSSHYYMQQTGAVVSAKLFAPKGRTLQSASDVRVIKATDDKGRVIEASQEGDESATSYVYSGGSQHANSTQIQLRLQLPQPDAQAIDEISAEATVITAGTWKEITLTNIQERATNELDLADVLPGAKFVITKFSMKNNQLNIQARIKGPDTIRRLDIQAKIPGSDDFSSYLSERNFSAKGGESTRTFSIQGYGNRDDSTSGTPLVLLVRYPEDLRRERVNFKLKGLDLL
jgi:hypothetical protein